MRQSGAQDVLCLQKELRREVGAKDGDEATECQEEKKEVTGSQLASHSRLMQSRIYSKRSKSPILMIIAPRTITVPTVMQ